MAVLILIDADCFFVCKPLGYIVFVIVASSFSLFLGDIDKFDVITLGNVGPEILAPLDGYTAIAAPQPKVLNLTSFITQKSIISIRLG